MAEEAELDLVEIAPMAMPPVCRVMDYGKYKYRESKKRHEAKLKQKQIVVKEIKFRPGTDAGDYRIKLRNLTRFLEEGDKAKVTLRFRGREMAHQELGFRLIERVKNELEPYSTVEQYPKMEGRQLVMVLAPRKTGKGTGKAAGKAAPKAAPKKRVATAKIAKPAAEAEAPAEVEKK
jgi:translation initiation factor IF-3